MSSYLKRTYYCRRGLQQKTLRVIYPHKLTPFLSLSLMYGFTLPSHSTGGLPLPITPDASLWYSLLATQFSGIPLCFCYRHFTHFAGLLHIIYKLLSFLKTDLSTLHLQRPLQICFRLLKQSLHMWQRSASTISFSLQWWWEKTYSNLSSYVLLTYSDSNWSWYKGVSNSGPDEYMTGPVPNISK